MSHRNRRTAYTGVGLLITGVIALTFKFLPSSAATTPPAGVYPPSDGVAVSLGDSYIAGEGSRWIGNALNGLQRGDVTGDKITIRESPVTLPDWSPGQPYADKGTSSLFPDGTFTSKETGKTDEPGCHRSDAAEVMVATGAVGNAGQIAGRGINYACSGAETRHLLTEGYKGERPQVDQLKDLVAQGTPVKLVIVSIGGNDVDVSGLARDCAVAYFLEFMRGRCVEDSPLANAGDQEYKTVADRIGSALASVKRVFTEKKLPVPQIVLQSYPNPLAQVPDLRPTTSTMNARYVDLGLPFDDVAVTLLRQVTTNLNTTVKGAALAAGVSFLDASGAVQGHELGSKEARLQERKRGGGPSAGKYGPGDLEWIRWVDNLNLAGVTSDAQRQQESLHPNYLGTQSQAACLESFVRQMPDLSKSYDGTCSVSATKIPALTTASTSRRNAAGAH